MALAACIWALTCEEEKALDQIAEAGFSHIDIRPGWLQSADLQEKARDLGLKISCLAASAQMPEGASLTGEGSQTGRDHVIRALEHGASLGAKVAYLVPEGDDLDRFAKPLPILAERAQELGMKLCVEHFPGTILPTVPFTLDYLATIGHPNLYLVFDIGHALMANENPADMIRLAGDRLGYVHLDDNDGENDLHLGLYDGVMTEDVLKAMFVALDELGYGSHVSLELKPDIPQPLDALKRSRNIVLSMI
jgi:sugar phosphate isomerase/epimerase